MNLDSLLNQKQQFRVVDLARVSTPSELEERLNSSGLDSSYRFVAHLEAFNALVFESNSASHASSLHEASQALQGLAELLPQMEGILGTNTLSG